MQNNTSASNGHHIFINYNKHTLIFSGTCWAEYDFSKYKCHCFPGFFGEECQYGPYCNPQNDVNMCKNGGKCR